MSLRILWVIVVLLGPSAALAQEPDVRFMSLAAGNRFTCGLTQDGRAYCWGSDEFGQLGGGGATETCERNRYTTVPCSRTPAPVAGEHRFTAITAGDSHACGLSVDGAVFCWGQNSALELGVPDAADHCPLRVGDRPQDVLDLPCSRRPTRVALERRATVIAAGDSFTCALDETGQPWCWGSQGRTLVFTPVTLDAPLTTLSAGGYDACGLTADGGLRCWDGRGIAAQLRLKPPAVEAGWRAVSVSTDHACALDSTSRAHCWGSDADGALGRGKTPHSRVDPLPLAAVLGALEFDTLVTGTLRTCGIDRQGQLHCWGRVPEARSDGTCLDSNGVAGTNDCTTHPMAAQGNRRFRTVTIGWGHQCGLTLDGVAVCWGRNEAGELGDGSLRSTDRATVVRVGGISTTRRRFYDARDSVSWLWSWRGGALLLAVAALGLLVRPIRRWWRAGPTAAQIAAKTGTDWLGLASVGLGVAGWAAAGLTILMLSQASGTGDVAYGLAMLAFMTGIGLAVVLNVLALVLAVIAKRNRDSTAAFTGLVLSSLTAVAAIVGIAWFFWNVR